MLRDKIRKVIADSLHVKLEEVTDGASFKDDLGIDSLESIELVMTLQEEFNMEIPDDMVEKMTKVKDVIEFIERNKE